MLSADPALQQQGWAAYDEWLAVNTCFPASYLLVDECSFTTCISHRHAAFGAEGALLILPAGPESATWHVYHLMQHLAPGPDEQLLAAAPATTLLLTVNNGKTAGAACLIWPDFVQAGNAHKS